MASTTRSSRSRKPVQSETERTWTGWRLSHAPAVTAPRAIRLMSDVLPAAAAHSNQATTAQYRSATPTTRSNTALGS
jgi:hypothetical protein